ncbi:MAG: secondary thiamine-phosphate synthase enzyme YjbQ [Myxococcota bacterium]
MKAHTRYLTMHTRRRTELVRITDEVAQTTQQAGIQEGMTLVSAMHITAGVFINDDEPGLHQDILQWLDGLAPMDRDYRHHLTGEDNGGAHLRNLVVGHQVMVPVTAGKLDLGPWQQIFYAEFDGQRDKRLIIKVMGE